MMNEKYKDIILLPHHESINHKRMSLSSRASIFAPFAALVGYEDAIIESGRVVTKFKELTQEEKEIISNKLLYLINNLTNIPIIRLTYFKKDLKKDGGQYITITTRVKKIDEINRFITLENKLKISIDSIMEIDLLEKVYESTNSKL